MTLFHNRLWQYITQGVALTLVYVAAIQLSDAMIRGSELVSPIGLSAGIAQAALLLLGRRMWLGVALGGFLGTISIGMPWAVACGAAIGSSVQALFGVKLLHRWNVRLSLERLRDVLGFIIGGVVLPTVISPTVSWVSLYLNGQIEGRNLLSTWCASWFAEGLGVLIITPLLLAWCYPINQRRIGSWNGNQQQMNVQTATGPIWKTVWLIALVTVSLIVFGSDPDWVVNHYPLDYLPLLLVIWAALQFGQRWAALGTFLVSVIAIGKTVLGISPFISRVGDWDEAILPLQASIGVVAITALVLAATVTERASTEESLRLSEAHYRRLFENAMEGIFQTAPDGKFLRANPALASILGYDSPEELMANLTDIAHQLYVEPQRYQELIQQLQVENAVLGFESQIYRRDGEVSWISETIRTVRDNHGEIVYYEGTLQDITERKHVQDELLQKYEQLESKVDERTEALRATNRQLLAEVLEHKQAEKKLRASQQRLSLLVQLAPLAVIEWNTEGEIVDWNPAAQAIFGYSKAEVLGSRGAELLVPERAREQVKQVFDELFSGKGGTRSCNENLTKDGKTIICDWYNVPLIDA
ncbi:MAG TPA: PAS domain S-box protein, partial [Coleofasciculaceae cyanobacterium]